MTPVDPLEQIAELRQRDRHCSIRRRRPDEAAPLQPLHEQAGALAIVPDHLDQIATSAADYEQMPIVRIAFQRFLDYERQAGKALAHIDMPLASQTGAPLGTGIIGAVPKRR